MLDLFDVPWNDLSLEDLAAFLEGAEPEPLQWEAKGTTLDPHHVRKTVGAFANSFDGGYLILGVEEDKKAKERADRWELSGFDFREEPTLWISKTVTDGLRPLPAVDVRTFEVGAGRHVAVVWTPPVPDPPCVTRGTVYERLPGQSVAVKDPQRLRDLYARGREAHEGAQQGAVGQAQRLLGQMLGSQAEGGEEAEEGAEELDVVRLVVGARTIGAADDISSRLFARTFADLALDTVERLASDAGYRGKGKIGHSQSAVSAVAWDPFGRGGWAARGSWNGAVAVGYDSASRDFAHEYSLRESITAAWKAALELLDAIGGKGTHYLTLLVTAKGLRSEARPVPFDRLSPVFALARGPVLGFDSDLVDHMLREIRRASGGLAFEDPS